MAAFRPLFSQPIFSNPASLDQFHLTLLIFNHPIFTQATTLLFLFFNQKFWHPDPNLVFIQALLKAWLISVSIGWPTDPSNTLCFQLLGLFQVLLHPIQPQCHHLCLTCFIIKITNSHAIFSLTNLPMCSILDWVPIGLYSTSAALLVYRSLYFLLFNQRLLFFPHFPPEITSFHDSLFQ